MYSDRSSTERAIVEPSRIQAGILARGAPASGRGLLLAIGGSDWRGGLQVLQAADTRTIAQRRDWLAWQGLLITLTRFAGRDLLATRVPSLGSRETASTGVERRASGAGMPLPGGPAPKVATTRATMFRPYPSNAPRRSMSKLFLW